MLDFNFFQTSVSSTRTAQNYFSLVLLILTLLLVVNDASAETWQGLTVEPENRCSPYRSKDYPYPQSIEPKIFSSIGKIYGPYTGRCFAGRYQTDIEHIVAKAEAHDSGLCAASHSVRREFKTISLGKIQINRNLNRKLHLC